MNDLYPEKVFNFINWFLREQDVAEATAEWFLKKILSNKELVPRVFITENVSNKPCSAVIATCNYNDKSGPDFICRLNDKPINHRTLMTHLLSSKEELYIQFKFKNYNDCSLLMDVLSDNETLNTIVIDIMLKMMSAEKEIKQIKEEIDIALKDKKKRTFNQLAKRLNELQLDNPLL